MLRSIEKLKELKRNFLCLKGDTRDIARGVALGTFIGMTPFPGFRMVIAIALAKLFRVHITAAALSVYSNNALTGLFISAFNYYVGMKVLNLDGMPSFPMTSLHDATSFIFHSGKNVFLSLSVGGVIVGVPFAIIMYYLSLKFFRRKEQRAQEHKGDNEFARKELVVN